MPLLTRDQLLGLKPKTHTIAVPEVGEVMIREPSAAEREKYSQDSFVRKAHPVTGELESVWEPKNIRARLIQLCVLDANGARLFNPSDIEKIGELPWEVVNPIYEAIIKVAGMGNEETTAKQEDIRGNSEAGPSETSSSPSPANSDAP